MIGFDTVRVRSRRRGGRLVGAALALLFVVAVQTASAENTAAIDAGNRGRALLDGLCAIRRHRAAGAPASGTCASSTRPLPTQRPQAPA